MHDLDKILKLYPVPRQCIYRYTMLYEQLKVVGEVDAIYPVAGKIPVRVIGNPEAILRARRIIIHPVCFGRIS